MPNTQVPAAALSCDYFSLRTSQRKGTFVLLDLLRNLTDRGNGRRGRRGERLAAAYLRKQGYHVLGRNLRSRLGEIDLLARDGRGMVAVIEVKTGTPGQGPPELRVDPNKQRRLAAVCAQISRRHGLAHARFRFDIVAVEMPIQGQPTVRHIPGAFESPV